MDFQEDSASDISPGLLVSLVILKIASVPGLPRLYRRGRPGTEAKVVSQLAPGRQLSIQASPACSNFSLQCYNFSSK